MVRLLLQGAQEFSTAVPAAASGPGLPIPHRPDELAEHYDLTLSHPTIDMPQFAAFERFLAAAAARRGLSCALIHDGILQEATQRLVTGSLTIGFHLDYYALWHVGNDPYARLAQAVQDAGGVTVNAPSRARIFTDKAVAHAEFVRHGLGVPETRLIRPWHPASCSTATADSPWYVKPANGFGGRGVVRTNASELATLVAGLREKDPGETWLVQREVTTPTLLCEDDSVRPAYWRVLYCFGDVLPFWWSSYSSEHNRLSYRQVTAAEQRRYHLKPLESFVEDIARLSGLEWFSTEICLSTGDEPSNYRLRGADGRVRPLVAIDYINDQCDVDVQSRWPGGPPDAVVQYLAERFVELAWHERQGQTGEHVLHFRRAA